MPRISKIRSQTLQYFKNNFIGIETEDDARALHYARNDGQLSSISYVDVVRGKFKKVSEAQSALHQLGAGNADNTKWVSKNGKQEYVFRYEKGSDSFLMDTSPLNQGTFNFVPTSRNPQGHKKADIYPWILWGNSEDDTRYTPKERNDLFKEALKDGLLDAIIGFDKPKRGGGGDDSWVGNGKTIKYIGGSGKDTVSYERSGTAVTANLKKGFGYDGHARDDKLVSIENLTGSRYSDIFVGDKKVMN